jgi:hypothetical protein
MGASPWVGNGPTSLFRTLKGFNTNSAGACSALSGPEIIWGNPNPVRGFHPRLFTLFPFGEKGPMGILALILFDSPPWVSPTAIHVIPLGGTGPMEILELSLLASRPWVSPAHGGPTGAHGYSRCFPSGNRGTAPSLTRSRSAGPPSPGGRGLVRRQVIGARLSVRAGG